MPITAAEAIRLLNRHDTLEERTDNKQVYWSISSQQAQDIAALIEAQEADTAAMRKLLLDILPMAMHESCVYTDEPEADPTTHCCDWTEIVKNIKLTTITTAGISLINRLEDAESTALGVNNALLAKLQAADALHKAASEYRKLRIDQQGGVLMAYDDWKRHKAEDALDDAIAAYKEASK